MGAGPLKLLGQVDGELALEVLHLFTQSFNYR